MFRENTDHLQSELFRTLNDLPKGMLEVLEDSWAGTFREEVFLRLDETLLAVLYSSKASRPNVPVNVLLGLEIMKAGFGWTDEELHQSFTFDLQVRYALGYEQVGEGHFCIRTLNGFRRRLRDYAQQTGQNLLEQIFAQITDEQRQKLSVKSDKLRMDSTQIASNIYRYGRIELLVEILQRVHRMLSEKDRERFDEVLAPYLESNGYSYTYRMKGTDTGARLDEIGKVMATLVAELAVDYAAETAYEQLVRVFHDHFRLSDDDIQPIPATEIKVTSLQSPDDPEATFHRKRNEGYRGYATHVTETCNPDNPLQLIVDVRTEPNAIDDPQMLVTVLPEVTQRMEVKELYTDGGYNSPKVDPVLAVYSVHHNQTALRGDRPHTGHLGLVDCTIEMDAVGKPSRLFCPMGHSMTIRATQTEHRYVANADSVDCQTCPLLQSCPARPKAPGKSAAIYFELRQAQVAKKRQVIAARPPGTANLRNAVESTIRSLKNPFRQGKVLVRGKFRVACQMIGSALMVNMRRIHRFQAQMAKT